MTEKFKNKYRIEPNRWKYWDYSAPGSYFITIVIQNRKHILGKIKNGKMILSEYGKIVEQEFLKINDYHKRARLDVYVIMQNHVHCIITLTDYNNGVNDGGENDGGENDGVENDGGENDGGENDVKKIHEFSLRDRHDRHDRHDHHDRQYNTSQLSDNEIKQYRKLRRNMVLIKILGKFQQQTSKQINILRNTLGTKNWQRDFYDHVIRNNGEYQRIQNYIINNPLNWNEDKFSG